MTSAAAAPVLNFEQGLAAYPKPELALSRPQSLNVERAHSQPTRVQLPAIKISRRPGPALPSNSGTPTPSPLSKPCMCRPPSPGEPPAATEDDRQVTAPADTAREASSQQGSQVDTLFMRLYKAHGGMSLVQSLEGPLRPVSRLLDQEAQRDDAVANKAAMDWRATCARAHAITTSECQRLYIEDLGMQHAPPADLHYKPERHYAPRMREDMTPHDTCCITAKQQIAATERALKQAPPRALVSLSAPAHLGNLELLGRAFDSHAHVPHIGRCWSSGHTHLGAADSSRSSIPLASTFDRLQATTFSPQKRYTDLDSPISSSPLSDAIGAPWDHLSQQCTLCGEQPCHVGSNCCSDCGQLKAFARKSSIRTVDLRSAIRCHYIDSSHTSSEEAFVHDMKEFVRGNTGSQAKRTMQAGARAERMNKRNRS